MLPPFPPKYLVRNEVIQLGLKRIIQLFPPHKINFNAVHVAGTNGKGTVCFYTAHMLRQRGLLVGRFNSPHLVDRWDCINIDGKPVDEGMFKNVETFYRRKNEEESIGASPFEILTATAFDLFNMHQVDVGVVEVGVGGREDATNIIPQERLLCSVVTHIGLDHQELLGDTIEKIAYQKAGIIKPEAPVIYDKTSPPEALEVITDYTKNPEPTPLDWTPYAVMMKDNRLAELKVAKSSGHYKDNQTLIPIGDEQNYRKQYGPIKGPFGEFYIPMHFMNSLVMSATATQVSLQRLRGPFVTRQYLMDSASDVQWPGRLQSLNVSHLVKRRNPVLLDGAHNHDSAMRLGAFVTHRFRVNAEDMKQREAVTWVLAASSTKDLTSILSPLLRSGDTVITTEFGPVDGMPWVSPASAKDLFQKALDLDRPLSSASCVASSARDAIERATEAAQEGPMVIAGSLYLVSDVLKLLRETDDDKSPAEWWETWEKAVKLDKSLWTARPTGRVEPDHSELEGDELQDLDEVSTKP